MAANPKVLQVVAVRDAGPQTRALRIACVAGGAFERAGGKYVIAHTGLELEGKAIKRAYSLMPTEHPAEVELVVKGGLGPGSAEMHRLAPGATLTFSGPWGKLVPEEGLPRRSLLLATDTGITAVLGVLEEAARGEPAPAPRPVLWLRAADERFLPVDEVRARLAACGGALEVHEVPAVDGAGRAERAARGLALARAAAERWQPVLVIATGDGDVVAPLRAALPAQVPTVREVRIECFFHNPEKKSA